MSTKISTPGTNLYPCRISASAGSARRTRLCAFVIFPAVLTLPVSPHAAALSDLQLGYGL